MHDFDRMVAEAYLQMSRERILDAAVERIASDGIDAVRIARIAMDAGVSTALVHYHFATREALLAEALAHSFELRRRRPHADPGEATATERLRDMVEQCLPLPGVQEERDWVLWVELWLRAVRHPELRPDRGAPVRPDARVVARGDRGGDRAASSPRATPGVVADRVLALIDGFGVRALLGDPAMPLERAREEVWDALARDLGLAPVLTRG